MFNVDGKVSMSEFFLLTVSGSDSAFFHSTGAGAGASGTLFSKDWSRAWVGVILFSSHRGRGCSRPDTLGLTEDRGRAGAPVESY